MLSATAMTERDRRLSEVLLREGRRLRSFIRARVADESDVEDLVQDVFSALVETETLMEPVQQVSAWLFRVARNRIIDRYRKQVAKPVLLTALEHAEAEGLVLQDWLPSPIAGPEAAYARGVLLEELEAALDELSPEQRWVFVAHELEGRSFKELAQETGLTMSALLARKHYAVLHLRERLRSIYREFVIA